jgi:CO dehydrogenase/acetyl-CoA synthase delta subunit
MTATCRSDAGKAGAASCCGTGPIRLEPRTLSPVRAHWTDGVVATAVGDVPRVRTRLGLRDRLGTLMVRSGFGRSRYRVAPGLYAAGSPTDASPVLLAANYKLSFDHLRRVLGGRDAWILVLDTHGINVWCAAGKGTFGTAELVRRVRGCGLSRVVTHHKVVAPQLGAPGIAAHEVRQATGFHVVYGPVRAKDLPAFLDARMTAEPEMRKVRFRLRDRLLLVPVELTMGVRFAVPVAAALLLLGGLGPRGFSLAGLATTGATSAALAVASYLTAQVLGPVLLPWLPGRAFSLKGAVLGLALVGAVVAYGLPGPGLFASWLHLAGWLALAPAITSFTLMNFTGASTYTSLSGVLREMRFAVPAQISAGAVGLVLWLAGLFVPGGSAR